MSRLMVPPYALLRGAQGAALAGAPVPFDASDPFAKYAAPGVWVKDFDYSRAAPSGLSRMYQASNGNVLVSATTQTIGFVLDETAAIGATVFSDDFGSYADAAAVVAAGWVVQHYNGTATVVDNTRLTLVSGVARVTNGVGSSDFASAAKGFTCVVGKTYRVTAAVIPVTASPQVVVQIGTTAGTNGTMLINLVLATSQTWVGYFRATATTHYFAFGHAGGADSASVGCDSVVIEELVGDHLIQTTSGQRGTSQDVSGVKVWRGDAVDDNLLAAISPAVATTMFLRVKPTGAARYLAGTLGGSTTRFYMTCNVTTGQLGAGVGSVTESTITGGSDIQNIEGVAVLRATGARVSLWWYPVGGALSQLYDDVQTGSPTTTIPFRFGAINNNGTVGSAPMAGDLYKIFVVQAAMSDADVATMAAAMAA